MNGTNDTNPLGDDFDRTLRQLTGLPDTIHTKPSTVTTQTPILNTTQTWIVQTYRQRDSDEDSDRAGTSRDMIFLQSISASGSMRIMIPPDVANVIARHREALTTKNRKAGARKAVETKRRKS